MGWKNLRGNWALGRKTQPVIDSVPCWDEEMPPSTFTRTATLLKDMTEKSKNGDRFFWREVSSMHADEQVRLGFVDPSVGRAGTLGTAPRATAATPIVLGVGAVARGAVGGVDILRCHTSVLPKLDSSSS